MAFWATARKDVIGMPSLGPLRPPPICVSIAPEIRRPRKPYERVVGVARIENRSLHKRATAVLRQLEQSTSAADDANAFSGGKPSGQGRTTSSKRHISTGCRAGIVKKTGREYRPEPIRPVQSVEISEPRPKIPLRKIDAASRRFNV